MVNHSHGTLHPLVPLLCSLASIILVGVDGKSEQSKKVKYDDSTIKNTDIFSLNDEGYVILVKGYNHFRKDVDFKIIEEELNRVDIKLAKANPDFKYNFEKIEGLDVLFMSQFKNLPAANILACNTFGDALSLQEMIENRIRISKTTMFTDNVIINKERINCVIHGVLWSDTSCVKQIFSTALVLGLRTPTNNTREYYSSLVSMQLENSVLYVYVNETNIWLDNTNSYVICKKTVEVSNDEENFKSIRVKHYNVLGKLLSTWINHLSTKYSLLMNDFSLMTPEVVSIKPDTTSNFCKDSLKLGVIVCNAELQFPSENILSFLEQNEVEISKADTELGKVFDFIRSNCDSELHKTEVSSLLAIMQNFKQNLMQKWEVDPLISEFFTVTLNGAEKNWDIRKCIQDSIHNKISDMEAIFHIYLSHNLKVHTLFLAKQILPYLYIPNRIGMIRKIERETKLVVNEKFKLPKTSKTNNLPRAKRWIWTDSLSKATGLARIKDVKDISDNQEDIRSTQIKDEEEIVKLEKSENNLLKELKDNSAQLSNLFENEQNVSKTLVEVMNDEKSIIVKLEKIAAVLELSSDLIIEFNDIVLSILSIQNAIDHLADTMDNLILGKVSTHLLDYQITKHLDANALKLATVKPIMSVNNCYVKISVPVFETWRLYRLRTIPFGKTNNGIYFKYDIDNNIYAISSQNMIFEYSSDICNIVDNLHVCTMHGLQIRVKPVGCGMHVLLNILTKNMSIPYICEKSILMVTNAVQEFMVTGNQVSLFSPYDDTLYSKINDSLVEVGKVTKGLNKIVATGIFVTSELLINNIFIDKSLDDDYSLIVSDLSKDFTDLLNFSLPVSKFNDSALRSEIINFVNAEGKQGVSLIKTEQHLKHIETLSMLSNFSISHFTLRKFDGLDGSMSWMLVLVASLVVFLPILACCGMCKCCRTGFIGVLKGVWFLLESICIGIFKLISCLCSTSKKTEAAGAREEEDMESGTSNSEGEKTDIYLQKLKKRERIAWYYTKVTDDRYLIFGSDSNETYSYSPVSNVVKNAQGKIVLNNKPSSLLLSEFEVRVADLPLPATKFVDGKRILLSNPNIYFDDISRQYKNLTTDEVEYGFRVPPMLDNDI